MMRRRGGPGLASTVARTAVVAGTATAVSNKVAMKQIAGTQAKQAAAQQAAAQQAAAQQAAAAPAPVAAPIAAVEQQLEAIQTQKTAAPLGVAPENLVGQLKQLADLRAAGVLNDAEFEQAKARLLGN